MALSKDRSDDAEDQSRSREIEHYFHPYDTGAQEHSEYIPERNYFSRDLRDKPAEDAKFQPALQDLLTRLYDRQRASADELLDFYMRRFNNSEFAPPETDEQVIDEFKQQYRGFAAERDRYVRDYQKAQALRDELQQHELTLEDCLDDKPKL